MCKKPHICVHVGIFFDSTRNVLNVDGMMNYDGTSSVGNINSNTDLFKSLKFIQLSNDSALPTQASFIDLGQLLLLLIAFYLHTPYKRAPCLFMQSHMYIYIYVRRMHV